MTAQGYTEIPLVRLGPWLIGIPVQIGDLEPRDFMLDTGAGTTVVDTEVAREAGLTVTDRGRARDAFNEYDIDIANLSAMRMGDIEITDLRVMVEDMAQLSEAASASLGGAIGHDVLSRYEVTFDVPSGLLRLGYGGPAAEDGSGGVALFDDGGGVFLTTVVEGIECRFLLDMGAGMSCLQGSSPLASRLEPTPRVARTVGPSGVRDHPIGRLRSLDLDEARVIDVEMVIGEFDLEDSSGRSADGLLGLDLLSKLIVTIDYPGGRARFRRRKQESDSPVSNP